MLEAFSNNATISANAPVQFNSVDIQKGCTATLNGTTSIALHKKGTYLVTFNATGTPAAAGPLTMELTEDGVTQKATQKSLVTLTTVGVDVNISHIVQVKDNDTCCCATSPKIVQFVNTSAVALNNANYNVIVTKLC